MPEGDTIRLTAIRLGRALAGKTVVRAARLDGSERLVGRAITSIESRGKVLLITFDDGAVLHSHMKMTGSWHLYRPGERWKAPAFRACVELEVADAVAVCFDAPVIEVVTASAARRVVSGLGPDLLSPDFERAEALRRLVAESDRALGDAVLQQSVVAGIGNIWKSETLFACRLDPFARVPMFSDDELGLVLDTARRLLSESVQRTRTGVGGRRHAAYGRSGRPCRVCGTTIEMKRQGDAGRSTYFCPRCQPPRR